MQCKMGFFFDLGLKDDIWLVQIKLVIFARKYNDSFSDFLRNYILMRKKCFKLLNSDIHDTLLASHYRQLETSLQHTTGNTTIPHHTTACTTTKIRPNASCARGGPTEQLQQQQQHVDRQVFGGSIIRPSSAASETICHVIWTDGTHRTRVQSQRTGVGMLRKVGGRKGRERVLVSYCSRGGKIFGFWWWPFNSSLKNPHINPWLERSINPRRDMHEIAYM